MRFEIYGRFVLEVVREEGRWVAFRLGEGTRRPEADVVLPPDLDESAVAGFLDDLFHELARPGQVIRELGR